MDTNRLLLIMGLFFVSFLIYQAWQKDFGPKQQSFQASGTPVQPADSTVGPAPAGQPTTQTDGLPSPAEGQTQSPPPVSANAVSTQPGKLIRIKTDLYSMRINLNGGIIEGLKLLAYPLEQGKLDKPFPLLDNQPPRVYMIKSGMIDAKRQSLPLPGASFEADKDRYDMGDKKELTVALTWEGENGLQVTKRFIFERGSYVVKVEHQVVNGASGPWTGGTYVRIERDFVKKSGMLPTYKGAALYSDEHKFEKIDFDDIKSYKSHHRSQIRKDIQHGWAAMLEHYFVTAAIPDKDERVTYFTDTNYSEQNKDNNRYWVGLVTPQKRIEPKADQTYAVRLYMGPKLQNVMVNVAPGLELTVNYGILTVISDPLFWLMNWIHSWIGNWGWSIVFVTLIIKLLFYPLSAASYRSMAKMRTMTPKVQVLRERYADDRQKMSQAMMDLYRNEKINPLGGCLPIVIQIPVFLALYWVLLESVELRQAPWMLWIHDLSTRDPYYILPIVMGGTMFLQQKLNPPQMDPTHQKIMQMLPIIFTLFTAFFPSGLVLYWMANNLLSIAQQWMITRQIEQASRKKT